MADTIKIPENLWVEHMFSGDLSDLQFEKYKAYYRGYLIYYDTRTRNKGIIHEIDFDRNLVEGSSPTTKISVFISPAPIRISNDPFPDDPGDSKDGVMQASSFTSTTDPQDPPKPRGF